MRTFAFSTTLVKETSFGHRHKRVETKVWTTGHGFTRCRLPSFVRPTGRTSRACRLNKHRTRRSIHRTYSGGNHRNPKDYSLFALTRRRRLQGCPASRTGLFQSLFIHAPFQGRRDATRRLPTPGLWQVFHRPHHALQRKEARGGATDTSPH